ncbi:hypothetical protein ACRQF6_07675 [Actinotignum sp. GS-2025f]|uniref:hypothetical protein n=1 Tax=Actinotignum TaxID=1653174 RepID=UPI002A7F4099|nr:hypothetical protein [Actinotignum sp. SLA_B059]MDY5128170.1 hypothetical protein [Actinotignum sp. SLA_B059]
MKLPAAAALQLIQNSAFEARRAWRDEISLVDVFLALLASGGSASRVCARAGLTLRVAREHVDQLHAERLEEFGLPPVQLRERTRVEIFDDAAELAPPADLRKFLSGKFPGHDYHCGVAIRLLRDEAACRTIVERAGIDIEQLIATLDTAKPLTQPRRVKRTARLRIYLPTNARKIREYALSPEFDSASFTDASSTGARWRLRYAGSEGQPTVWELSEPHDLSRPRKASEKHSRRLAVLAEDDPEAVSSATGEGCFVTFTASLGKSGLFSRLLFRVFIGTLGLAHQANYLSDWVAQSK